MGLALQHLFRYREDPSFMKRIVTDDETGPSLGPNKKGTHQWNLVHPRKKFRAVKSAGKVLLTVFFDVQRAAIGIPRAQKSFPSHCEHFDAYAGPSEQKTGASPGVWFCSMITRVPRSRVTQMGNGQVQMEDVGPSALQSRVCHPAISVFGPLNKTL
ncbi:hypothetical protein TNIN_91541 [Trichonephila inaurata madagascariensis]|uniref:Uncharacterized protein n=1 Tax=Trichonephila inaurata madagascariensis TaxID=2747483 RepID=A0A8X6YUI5_9ARAC|nr:hypothetical protein TNIN_91541 [Trichonephila inaurata madagascariensis]